MAEILINTPAVQEALRKGEFHRFKELIVAGHAQGMQSFDQGICDLFVQQKIGYEDALEAAEYKNEFRQMVKQIMEKVASETVSSDSATTAKNEAETEQHLSLFEEKIMTLSDVHDDNSDAGSIFTHR
ncbi:MAG: hypothetical protein PHQ03_04865 [Methylococcales bacterium]|nr:hypothetical protein [Methylococcales bacterium]